MIKRYVIIECLTLTLAISVILAAAISSAFVGDYLADVSTGKLPGEALLLAVSLRLIKALSLLLPLAFFLAGLVTLGRLSYDRELIIIESAGQGPLSLVKIWVWLSLPLAVVVAAISFSLGPNAASEFEQLRVSAASQLDASSIVAGRFQTLGDGRTIYAEKVDTESGALLDVFVRGEGSEFETVLVAETGHLLSNRELVLERGYQWRGGWAGNQLLRFDRYRLQLRTPETELATWKMDTIQTAALWAAEEPLLVAEWHWRLAWPVATVLLGVVVVPVGRLAPRQSRFVRVLPGLLLFLVYYNVLSAMRIWLEEGVLPSSVGLWPGHALVAGVALLWLRRAGR